MKRAVAIVAALALAGCGSGSSGNGDADPATVAPANTFAYASLTLQPDGADREEFDQAAAKILATDAPEERVGELFTAAFREGSVTWDEDIKPWLGRRAAIAVTRAGARHGEGDFAVIVASKDTGAAEDAIEKDLKGVRSIARSYKGAEYRLKEDGIANGVVGDFLVAGSEPAFRAVVDASEGTSLAETDGWKRAVGDRAAGKEGLAWVDPVGLVRSASGQLPAAQRLALPLVMGLAQVKPFVATLDAKPDRLVIDVASPGTPADPRGPAAASSDLIEELPGNSWAAAAAPGVGEMLGTLVKTVGSNPLFASAYARVRDEVRRASGLDVEADLLPALGDVAVFARGRGRAIAGGLVLRSEDPAALRRTLTGVRRLSRRDAKAARLVRTAQAGAKGVVGVRVSRRDLAPAARLGDATLFRKAARTLGSRPTAFAAVQPLLDAARTAHPEKRAKLERKQARLAGFEYFAAGARRDGDSDVIRVLLGLR